ncbi:MAG: polysaccharide biosynthesis protein [Phycisphaerales bacterium]|nr:polysaccharide biosynthesis protein [Phycisphaerales bacterium]
MSSTKSVLITGGTGSFGQTMLHRLLDLGCPEIRILSRDEEKQDALRNRIRDQRVQYIIGDVRDRRSVDLAMAGVDLVFHAAALKQVPSCEFFPVEAVRTNVLGSGHVVESAVKHGVERIVCLSTDKAVQPVNAMGMTKALMEKVVQSTARRIPEGGTIVACVRYGNVMCSRGSVIPLFIRQILAGEPMTITEPSMTRFMLPLRDAVSLVEFALANAQQGDTFIQKAPACTIQDLATATANVMGVKPNIKVIGIRHGEKVFETLASAEEIVHAQDMGDYYRIPYDDRDLNYAKFFSEGETSVAQTDPFHSHNARQLSVPEVESLLRSIEYVQDRIPGGARD